MNIRTITDRFQIGQLLNDNGLLGSVAEIGCCFGGYSKGILQVWKGKEYVMVDPWIKQPKNVYKEKTDNVDYEGWYKGCCDIAAQYPIVKMVRKMSVDGAKDFPDEYFDWVFIDGNHSFEAVTQDMNAWYPKVKTGCLFSGHDFYNDTNWPHWCEVKRAVETWIPKNGYTMDDVHLSPCSTWIMVKK